MLRFDERVHLPKNRENTITFLVNGEPIGTVETLAPGAKTVDIPIPPVDYDSVTDALGYVPYDSSNPDGYITSSALTNYVTTNTNQTITAVKSFHNAELLTDNFITLNGTTAYLRGQSGINYYNLMNLNSSGITVGSANQPIKIAGSTTRPQYNSNDLALYSDIPTEISDLVDDTATTPIDKAESVVDNNSGSLKFWSGTKAQYDAIVTKDANTLYNITDDANPTLSILEMLYPVGSIYIGTMSDCPLQTLGVGTWQLVATDRVLQGAGRRGDVGDTLNESLPNHKHIETFVFSEGLRPLASVYGAVATSGNTKSIGENITHTSNDSVDKALTYGADNAIYQDSAPVQQDAYLVNIWERIS